MTYAPAFIRLGALICFALAFFGTSPRGYSMTVLGLFLWCLSGPWGPLPHTG